MTEEVHLPAVGLLEGCPSEALGELESLLTLRQARPGTILIREGALGDRFMLVIEGRVEIVRDSDGGSRRLAVAGPGSVLGELALLRGEPRLASVLALTPVVSAEGDDRAFAALLALPGLFERVARRAAANLAANVEPVVVAAPHLPVSLRPLLPTDRDELALAIRGLSDESRLRRFFIGGQPTEQVINYLAHVDFINHFAWLALDEGGAGIAVGRYVRLTEQPDTADLAFEVVDAHQGQGLGTMLLGALAAVAGDAHIACFHADVLADNRPMRRVLDKAGALWELAELGVVRATVRVDAARSLIALADADKLEQAARDTVTAAGLALA